ncbi:MAG: sigma-70 family RNA polymerase sigma factor [Chitinivibrionales bacterium]|nr:sigma-70 family RNA polymerase sigma factor [Chitinivibrionales bacterium]
MTDTEIISAVRSGDRRAFNALVDKYEPQVAATVIGMLGRGPEAAEVGQDVFVRFYKALDDFRGEAGVGTYLTRIAMNLSYNEIKRRMRRREIYNNEIDIEELRDDKNYDPERNSMVRAAVLRLKPKYRSVVVLRLIEGHSTNETAKILSLPLGTVLSRLSRAQKMLREILQ